MLVTDQDRKHIQLATSHKPSCEASRRAECGKSACSVRRGGGWKPATVRLVRHSQRKRRAPDRPDLRAWRHSSTLPAPFSRTHSHFVGLGSEMGVGLQYVGRCVYTPTFSKRIYDQSTHHAPCESRTASRNTPTARSPLAWHSSRVPAHGPRPGSHRPGGARALCSSWRKAHRAPQLRSSVETCAQRCRVSAFGTSLPQSHNSVTLIRHCCR